MKPKEHQNEESKIAPNHFVENLTYLAVRLQFIVLEEQHFCCSC